MASLKSSGLIFVSCAAYMVVQDAVMFQNGTSTSIFARTTSNTESHTRNLSWGPTSSRLLFAAVASGEIEPMFTARPLKLAFRRKCEDGMGVPWYCCIARRVSIQR